MAVKTAAAAELRPVPLAEALGERYLSYALSTIMARSLPDVRDGLKPVHRRLLYAMYQLKLDPASGFKKCARVVGDVMGKYHPHGDAAIYDAMVRMAQNFSMRQMLIDGQGNFGNIDGDNAAAMRYTEARLTDVSQALLEGIDEDAVDFRPTYDGEGEEPVVMPANFPNLLANGAAGIAVGMATSVPPHNVGEICIALLHLIKFPKAHISKLVELMPGPDFPTGGMLVESPEAIVAAYSSGRGSFRTRARWAVEKLGVGQYQVVVNEIPYQVQKSRLIEKIAELLAAKKLTLLADVRDESTEDVRLVLEPKSRNVDPKVLMESLFRQTELEARFPLNMNVLDADNVPRVMNLREVLQAFLDHRHVVLKRRSKFRLGNIERRLEILDGYLIAYLNLDAVIRIVRKEDDPKSVMMRKWKLTDMQAEAILNMRLRALRKLEEIEIKREHDKLSAERKELNRLLKDEDRRWQAIAAEIAAIRKRFGEKTGFGRRRTEIADAPAEVAVPVEALIEREPLTVVCSIKGWVRAFKGHVDDLSEVKYKEGDGPKFAIKAESTDKLLVFASNGRFYMVPCDGLPRARGDGEPLKLMVDMGEADIVQMLVHKPDRKLLVVSSDGRGFIVPEAEVVAQTRAGKQALNLGEGAEARVCTPVEGDTVAVLGENRKLLCFKIAELPEMNRGRGVILQRYKQGGLADVKVFSLSEGLSWRSGAGVRTETNLRDWIGQRSQAGRLPPAGFTRANRFT
ncbi:MAG: DNA topoisomerase IV subunit A [Rhodospirillales bacterium]|nr:DNA topoisomerase IV subunit A [Rhodospirillales bacterium]